MKIIITFIVTIFFSTSSFAGELSEQEVLNFLKEWLAAQNSGSYSSYAAMYAKDFTGIKRAGASTSKLDRDAWLKDRKKMFNKKMVVEAIKPEIKIIDEKATIKFEQKWESGTYKDTGDKLIELIFENSMLKVYREEMINSRKLNSINSTINFNNSKITSIKDNDCKKISSRELIKLFGNDNVFECPSPKGWRLFKELDRDEARSWINLSHGGSVWTTIDFIWGDEKYEFGLFPNIDGTQVEWRTSERGEPTALIFRVIAQNPNKQTANISRWYALRLLNNIPSFCGIVNTIEEARVLIENESSCKMPIRNLII